MVTVATALSIMIGFGLGALDAAFGRTQRNKFMKGDDRVDEALPAKGAGNMERFLALHEFEPEARQRLPHAVYEYVAGGAGEEHSIRANEESYQRIFLRPRVLRSVTPVDLSQELFGRPLPAPTLLAPAAYQRLMHPKEKLGSLRGANRHGVPFILN